MSAKSWNKAFGITPSDLKKSDGKTKLTARKTDLYVVVVSPDKGAFIWDVAPANCHHRGWVMIKQPAGYTIYQVYAHASFYARAQIEQRMAEFFPIVSGMDISE